MAEKGEVLRERVILLGPLSALGLGNANGWRSPLPESSQEAYGQQLTTTLVRPEDDSALACIDDRIVLSQADGTPYRPRMRQAGAAIIAVPTALLGESPVPGASVSQPDTDAIFGYSERATGKAIASHEGGCAAGLQLVVHIQGVSAPEVISAVKTLMNHELVTPVTDAPFSDELGERVRTAAPLAAEALESVGWDGAQFTQKAKDENPAAVEDLQVDPDHEHHGHAPGGIVVILGDETIDERKIQAIGIANPLVVNVRASMKLASAFAGQRGRDGYVQGLIANLAHHLSIANAAVHPSVPVYLVP